MNDERGIEKDKGNGVLADVSRSVTMIGYVAMNKGEFDISNMTFYKSSELEKAKRHWGNKQDIIRVTIKFDVDGK